MTISDAFTVYPWGALALIGFLALIDRHTAREAFLGSLLWPIVLVLLAGAAVLGAVLGGMERLGFRWDSGRTLPGIGWRIGRTKNCYIGFYVETPAWMFCFGWGLP